MIFQPVWSWNLMDDLEEQYGTSSSFVHHFKSFGEFKLELQSRNNQVKIGDILSCVTLKFDGRPWKTIGHLFYTTASFVHRFKGNGEVKLTYSLEIWWMTLQNNRAPLLCSLKLCASFHSHWWIQTGVTVRKHSIWVKIEGFYIRVTLKFHKSPWKQ